ncbi:hypothetical protein [uncultured Methanolobus sp.]|uniref:HEAT repeat domain-containing protein n=1 Tax=uncultured Methanolobus sp. TaxID=218300 RepID=UPI002AAC1DDA|nr:hypothetical protein [uncultured Methanolobus sp.]
MSANQDEIHGLSLSKDVNNRLKAADLLSNNFESLNDKSNAWSDLIRLAGDEDSDVRYNASFALAYAVPYFPDKYRAWNDLVRLTNISDSEAIHSVASAIGSVFTSLPDKSDAWFDLIKLTGDDDPNVRDRIISTIGDIFSYIPNQFRNETFEAIHTLVEDEYPFVRFAASYALAVSFEYLPDELKVQAWNALYALVDDIYSDNRWCASDALSYSFQYVPDEYKLQAWDIVQELLNDDDEDIRQGASSYISYIFKAAPEEAKYDVWKEMCRLTQDENNQIVTNVSYELSNVFPFISDNIKLKTETYLYELLQNTDPNARASANHSIGKISIYKASNSESENELKYFLEKAITHFENAAKEDALYNPAKFCYPFYRSFDAVIFKKTMSKKEIDVYIENAKEEIGGSESKQKLLEAVEQLANVLETVQSAKDVEFEHQEILRYCSDICTHVDQLMDENKYKTPAMYLLFKKSSPFFRANIKELIDILKKKAEVACKEAKGTDAESIVYSVNKQVQKWEIGSQEQMKKNLDDLFFILNRQVPTVSGNENLISRIEEIQNCTLVEDQIAILTTIISVLPTMSLPAKMDSFEAKLDSITLDVEHLIVIIKEQSNTQEYLDTIQQKLEEIKHDLPGIEKKIDDVLYDLYSPMGVDQKLRVALPIIPMLVSYEIEANVPKFVADRIFDLKMLLTKHEN